MERANQWSDGYGIDPLICVVQLIPPIVVKVGTMTIPYSSKIQLRHMLLKLRSSLLCSLPSHPQKRNGCRCVRHTLNRCPTTSPSAPFDHSWIWITPSGLLWVELSPPRTRYIGDSPGFHSTMSQGRRILHSSMVRPTSAINGSFPTQSIHGNVGCRRIHAIFAGC